MCVLFYKRSQFRSFPQTEKEDLTGLAVQFIMRVLLPVTPITVVAFLAAYSPRLFMQPGFWRLVVVTLISTVVTVGMTYAIAEPEAKEWIKSKLKKLLRH